MCANAIGTTGDQAAERDAKQASVSAGWYANSSASAAAEGRLPLIATAPSTLVMTGFKAKRGLVVVRTYNLVHLLVSIRRVSA